MPIYKEMLRLDAEGKLSGAQKSWMAYSRPPEELYDVRSDPFQVNNLINDCNYMDVLADLRKKHEAWSVETGDMGRMNEPELVDRMWPSGIQPVTDIPYFVVNSPEDRSTKNHKTGGTYTSPVTLGFYCPTHGSSIIYTYDSTENPHWKLYSGPIKLSPGKHNVRVKAVRYGYKDSDELKGEFIVR